MKPRWSLLPPKEVRDVVDVLTFGAKSHDDFGWKDKTKTEHFDALMRHINEWRSGNKLDNGPDGSGKSHLAHAVCRLLFLMYLDKRG
jgi:hypothetical protein